jgi:PAS domain S-box-containing protein
MNETLLVNFHSHSIFSDGEQTPETLAANLAATGVRYAALTDHDSLEGLPRFQEALKKRGIASVTGVELTTLYHGREAHLLAYGFDPLYPDLVATLQCLRQVRRLEVQSIAGSLRKMGANQSGCSDDPHAVSAAPDGQLEISRAIDLIHRAGGRVFWAHPLHFEPDLDLLDSHIKELKSMGLDGLEAIYAPFSEEQRHALLQIAEKHALLVCAGTDFHVSNGAVVHPYGIEMPRAAWIRFREVIFSSPALTSALSNPGMPSQNQPGTPNPIPPSPHHFRRRYYLLRIFIPTMLAILLFLAAIWGIILPSFEQSLLDRKRELILELTNSAWSILASYERDVQSGLLSRELAQAMAISRIEALRYGADRRDYFWIQDMQPRMIMHPYRSDLNGQDLRSFTDPRGVPIFVEFTELVREKNEGYVDYVWQWFDDPQRLEPKESYVKGFEPWGWVIGTGIYIDDVNEEIARIEQNIITSSMAISGAVVLLLAFVMLQSLRIERERQEILDNLRESTERYHTLIEATTEGTLLVLDGRCRYANPTFLTMTGYTTQQLEFLDLADLLPQESNNQAFWQHYDRMASEQTLEEGAVEGVIKHANGHLLECILTGNLINFAGQRGYILLVKDIGRQSMLLADGSISHAAQSAALGIFRARAARRAVLVEMNPAAQELFALTGSHQPALADLFSDPSEFEAVYQALQNDGEINHHILHLETSDAAARFLSLSASLVQDEIDHTTYIDGILEDITAARKKEAGREALIERLQTSLLFLHEPISSLGRDVVVCDMNTTVAQLSRMMTARNVTAALVASENSAIIGIVTDHDLRARVLSEKIPSEAPVHTIMSAPIMKISEEALIYEALMRMEEKGLRHLAVESSDGKIVSVIDNKSLIQFQRYGPIVVTREISRSGSVDEVAHSTGRTPPLVKSLLESSARPRYVTNMLASICDAATERLVELAIQELGPPPAAFAFIAMGSQGRQEQTLLTDQDNGIIFAPAINLDQKDVNTYFLRLGDLVCQGLDRAGYQLCRGQVMANNPRWCRSLPDWISGFEEWIQKSEPQEIIDFSIFFDFRTVYGEAELAHQLRRTIHTSLADKPAFFHHFAKNALLFKPPFRLLGSIYLGGGAAEHPGEINLKDAMMPMVSFARLYALHHQINQTHTLERIEVLSERNLILPSSRDEIVASYDFLMQLRLQNQIAAIQEGRPPQNTIHPGKLGYIQQELLKQAFAQVAAVQKKVSYDFLGGV